MGRDTSKKVSKGGGVTHLWQHLVLTPPTQRYSQQVIHHRGRLQADDAIVVVFRNPAQDGVSVGLKNETRSTDIDAEVAQSYKEESERRRGERYLRYITMDSLMSSSSKASSVFSWGQNKLREKRKMELFKEGWPEKEKSATVTMELWEQTKRGTYFSPEYTRGRRLRL